MQSMPLQGHEDDDDDDMDAGCSLSIRDLFLHIFSSSATGWPKHRMACACVVTASAKFTSQISGYELSAKSLFSVEARLTCRSAALHIKFLASLLTVVPIGDKHPSFQR